MQKLNSAVGDIYTVCSFFTCCLLVKSPSAFSSLYWNREGEDCTNTQGYVSVSDMCVMAWGVIEGTALGKKLFFSLFVQVLIALNLLPGKKETNRGSLMMLLALFYKRLA